METPAQTCTRIAAALEDLARQEAAALQARDFTSVALVQDRAAPLVEHLVVHEAEIVSEELRARIAGILALRSQTAERLAENVRHAREELRQMDASQRRVSRIAPAYGTGAARVSRLSAVG
jgi:hypothetical protein